MNLLLQHYWLLLQTADPREPTETEVAR